MSADNNFLSGLIFSSEYLFIMNSKAFFAPVINSSTVKEGSIL